MNNKSAPATPAVMSIFVLGLLCSLAAWAGKLPQPKVELLDPGAEPRKILRYDFVVGDSSQAHLRWSSSMQMEVLGTKSPEQPFPVVELVYEIRPVEITDDGNLKYGMQIDSVELEKVKNIQPDALEQVKNNLDKMKNIVLTALVSRRGLLLEEAVKGEVEGFGEDTLPMSQHLTVPLPNQPVGRGARWQIQREVVTTIPAVQTTTYTLEELTATGARLKVHMLGKGPIQEIEDKAVLAKFKIPPSSRIKVGVESEAQGELTVNWNTPLPQSRRTNKGRTIMQVKKEGDLFWTKIETLFNQEFIFSPR